MEAKDWKFPHENDAPYNHCSECKMSARNGGKCQVYDKYQRLPREKYRGALGQCMQIGGPGM